AVDESPMGRYKVELDKAGASKWDKAGPYLEAARASRQLVWDSRRLPATKPYAKAPATTGERLELECFQLPADGSVGERKHAFEQAVRGRLHTLSPGQGLVFCGLDSELRAIVHSLAHLLGLPKVS
ncbi:unnamed protein product, partial [Polarella glacialis]